MIRTIALMLALLVGAPLFGGGLVEKVFSKKIADDWYTHFQKYVDGQCTAGQFPETWFPDADGKPHLYRIMSVSDGKLIAAELTISVDDNGNESRTPAKDTVTLEWKQWPPRYMVSTYPVATNPDSQDVIAFGIWLYLNADDLWLGNRVLTVVYEANPDLRDDLAGFMREHHLWGPRDKLTVGEVWDGEFAKWRRVLMPKKEADQQEKDRAQDCKDVVRLLGEYKAPGTRTLTLAEIAFQLREWRTKHGKSDIGAKYAGDVTSTLEAIAKDLANIETFVELADGASKAAKPSWDAVAGDYEKALALDTQDARLLSLAADAWTKHANPEVVGGQFKCTQEHSARRALELYERWHEREPKNYKVILNMGVCNHVVGQRDAARKLYNRVIDECGDKSLIKQARDYEKLP
ncbi:MAG: hypothetical protein KDB90_16690 [Planctomycetes bacterium]|nr:hypothetical protein [Planctomycetota bacterium]